MSDGFLGRWAKRKEAVRKGEVVEHEAPSPQPSPASGRGSPESFPPPLGEGQGGGTAAQTPPPTLEDTQALTPASDFTRFVRPDVAPEVKNAALKKLFADPHFNVMDRLDVYIDDYSRPDPLPPEMLRQLASAKFLKLFDEEQEPREDPDAAPRQTVAQSEPGGRTEQAVPPADQHADPDLRLQQDHAPGPAGPGQGTE